MNPSDLTDPLISKMSPEARRKLGLQTAEEAMATFTARSEKELQQQITNLLRLRGIIFLNPPMSKKSPLPIGWPDFTIFLMGGRTIFVECKVEKGKLSEEQTGFQRGITSLGFPHYIVRELREMVAILDEQLLTYIG